MTNEQIKRKEYRLENLNVEPIPNRWKVNLLNSPIGRYGDVYEAVRIKGDPLCHMRLRAGAGTDSNHTDGRLFFREKFYVKEKGIWYAQGLAFSDFAIWTDKAQCGHYNPEELYQGCFEHKAFELLLETEINQEGLLNRLEG